MVLTRSATIAVAFMVILGLAPVWARYGALAPGHGHGGGEVDVAAFQARALAYVEAHGNEDGSVEAQPGDEPMPVVLRQFGFQPRTIHMRTGQRYTLELLAIDVMHGFSLNAGEGSLNALLFPGQPTRIEIVPTRPGRYLLACNEYCGLGHHLMSGEIVVEGEPVDPADVLDGGHDTMNEHGAAGEHDTGEAGGHGEADMATASADHGHMATPSADHGHMATPSADHGHMATASVDHGHMATASADHGHLATPTPGKGDTGGEP